MVFLFLQLLSLVLWVSNPAQPAQLVHPILLLTLLVQILMLLALCSFSNVSCEFFLPATNNDKKLCND